MRSVVVPFVFLAATVLACSKDGDEHPPGAAGARLFDAYCARCHGEDGAGKFLAGVPPNRETRLSREQIADLVIRGLPDHDRMPTLPRMSRGEALSLADHIATLRERSEGERVFWMVPPRPKTAPAPKK